MNHLPTHTMTDRMLPLSVRIHTTVHHTTTTIGDRARAAWADRADEAGVDEAVTKMIWLAVGVGVAVVATTFFVSVFKHAEANVPNPTGPTP